MSSWNSMLIAFAVCLAVCVAERNRIIVKHQFGVPTFLSVGSYSKTTVLYSVCEVLGRPKEICDIVLESNNFDNTNKTLSCQVNMNPYYKTLQSVQVGEDKAVLVQIRVDSDTAKPIKNSVLLTNIDFNGCRITNRQVTIPLTPCNWDIRDAVVLSHEHSYDIIIRPNSSLCNEIYIQSTYDLKGNTIKEFSTKDQFHDQNTSERFFKHIKFHYSINGQVWSNNTADLVLVVEDKKILKAWDVHNADNQRKIIYSTSYNTLSACLQESNAVANCTQFDLDGQLKLEIILEYFSEAILAMHNLPEGFLILTKKCMNGPLDNCSHLNYYVKHFDGSGQMVNAIPIQFDDFQWNLVKNRIMIDFFENKFGGYCISLFNFDRGIQFYPRMRPARLELTAQCFSDL